MDTEEILEAIFTVNFNAKVASSPKQLYFLKDKALQKLINEGKAEKVGLTYSKNHRFSQQQIDVSVKCTCGKYYFHMPPDKNDIKTLPHITLKHKNPGKRISLGKAKFILMRYISR